MTFKSCIPAVKRGVTALLGCALTAASIAAFAAPAGFAERDEAPAPGRVGVAVANYMIKTWPTLDDTSCGANCFSLDYAKVPAAPSPKYWEYTNGVPLVGIWKLYQHTGNKVYFDYVKKFVDTYVDANGKISYAVPYPTPSVRDATIQDVIQPSNLLFGLYEETKDARYLTAMAAQREVFKSIKTNSAGAFWHKPTYPNQQWLDGLYMAEPFLVKYCALYAAESDKAGCFSTATTQAKLMHEHLFDANTHLYYHAWNGAADGIWLGLDPKKGKTPPVTGAVATPVLWSRSIAWLYLGVIDMLDYLPRNHPDRALMLRIVNNVSYGLARYQDRKSGLWYQVIDLKDGPLPANGGYPGESIAAQPNFRETSASALFTYGLAKSVRKGYVSPYYLGVAHKGWRGVKSQIDIASNGDVKVHGTVVGMSIGGTYNSYVNADFRSDLTTGALPAPAASCSAAQLPGGFPTSFTSAPTVCKFIYVRDNVPQGIGAVLLAASEMEHRHLREHHGEHGDGRH